ncbi:uncharacterized protein LOC134684347 [Mytilus trossulus]|uniref:uncharacterized protein LOC134684347 n=1 Tax=Mytilus trossulus TaxID=6551 RepID=UPI00300584B7
MENSRRKRISKGLRKRIRNWSSFFNHGPRTYTSTLDEIRQPPSTLEGITPCNPLTLGRATFAATSDIKTTETTYLNKKFSARNPSSTQISIERGAQVPINCKVCKEDLNVQYQCKNCFIALCYTCCKKHMSKSSYQDHRVINVNNGSTILKPIKCQVKTHKKDDISIFCQSCDKFMCLKCLTECNHQTTSLKELETLYSEDIDLLNKYHKIMDEDYKNKFMGEIAKLQTSLRQHEEFYEKEKKKIIHHDKVLKEEITKHTNKLLAELDMELKKTKADLENQSLDTERNICKLVEKISSITNETSNSDIMCIHEVKKEIEEYLLNVKLSNVSLPFKVKTFLVADFQENSVENFYGILQNSVIDMEIVIRTYNTNLKSITSLLTTDYAICLGSKEDSLIRNVKMAHGHGQLETLQEIKDVKIEHLFLSNKGNILVSLHNDPCIKMLTKSGQMNKFYEFSPTDWFGNPQVPLCFHILQEGKRIIGTKEINGELFPLSQTSCRQMLVQSSDGKQLNCYERDKKGNRLFTLPYRITSNSKTKICVLDRTDARGGRIVTIDSEGVVEWIYNGHPKKSQLKFNPTDIVTTFRDNIVISDLNNAIHIINYNGEMVSFLQTKTFGILLPLSIDIYCKDELLIGCKHDQAKLHIMTFNGF